MKPSITIKGSIVMNNKAWDKQKAILDGWSPEEVEILYADYQKYLEQLQRWHWKDGLVMDFDDRWRAMADNEMDKREGK